LSTRATPAGAVVAAGWPPTWTHTRQDDASFEYTLSDGTEADVARVAVTVTAVNDAPSPGGNLAATSEDTAVSLSAAELLADDSDPEAQALTVSAVGGPVHGSVALSGTTITFSPEANFFGEASFAYTASDGTATATASVTVTVSPINDAPVAADDHAAVPRNGQVVIDALDLLTNDSDIEADPLSVIAVQDVISGSAVLQDGSITFSPAPGFVGLAELEYVISDGQAQAIGRIFVDVYPVCGDGIADPPEECDDGNLDDGDGCTGQCTEEYCGDGSVNGGGVVTAIELTFLSCTAQFGGLQINGVSSPFNAVGTACGCDGEFESILFTDPFLLGALQDGSNAFQVSFGNMDRRIIVELSWIELVVYREGAMQRITLYEKNSGDAASHDTDVCDDAPVPSGQWFNLDADILLPPPEECEPANTATCDDQCQRVPVCNDGFVDEPEVCEDGNTDSGDGCRGDCLGVEVCGDGLVDVGEECPTFDASLIGYNHSLWQVDDGTQRPWENDPLVNYDYRHEDSASGDAQSVQVVAQQLRQATFPLTSVSIRETSDGVDQFVQNFVDLAAGSPVVEVTPEYTATRICAIAADVVANSSLVICDVLYDYPSIPDVRATSFTYIRDARSTSYSSRGFDHYWSPTTGQDDFFAYNPGTPSEQYGLRYPEGAEYGIHVAVVDDSGQDLGGSFLIPVGPYSDSYSLPRTCVGDQLVMNCHTESFSQYGSSGTSAGPGF
jgi:cysteine-rich repeat protein